MPKSPSFFKRTTKISPLVESENLLKAAREGNLEVISAFLKKAKNPNILIDGTTIFHEAAATNQTEVLKLFLKHKKFDINQVDGEEKTALCRAAENNSAGAAMLIVANGADVDKSFPLKAAVLNNHAGIVQILINQGADIKRFDEQRNSLFHFATAAHSVEALRFLCEESPDKIFLQNFHGKTPFSTALEEKNSEMVILFHELLLKNPSKYKKVLDLYDTTRKTATILILEQDDLDLVKRILKETVAKNIRHPGQWLSLAISSNKLELVKFLVEEFKISWSCEDYLEFAIKEGATDIAKYLLEKDKKFINEDEEYRKKLVRLIGESGKIELFDAFIANGFEIRNTDILRTAILQFNIIKNNRKASLEEIEKFELFIKHLLDAKVDCSDEKSYDASFLHLATKYRCGKNILRILVEAGVNLEVKNPDGETALMTSFDSASILTLVRLGANASATREDSKTLMHKIVHHSLLDKETKDALLKELIMGGINIDMKSTNGETPLHYAMLTHNNSAQTLIKLGASKTALNKDGQTALMVAVSVGNIDGAEFILSIDEKDSSIDYGALIAMSKDQAMKDYLGKKQKEQIRDIFGEIQASRKVEYSTSDCQQFSTLSEFCLESFEEYSGLVECQIMFGTMSQPVAIISKSGSWSISFEAFDKAFKEATTLINPFNREPITLTKDDENIKQLVIYFAQLIEILQARNFYFAAISGEKISDDDILQHCQGSRFAAEFAKLAKEKPTMADLTKMQAEIFLQNPPSLLSNKMVLMEEACLDKDTGKSEEKSDGQDAEKYPKNFTLCEIITNYRKLMAQKAVAYDKLTSAVPAYAGQALELAIKNLEPIKSDKGMPELFKELEKKLSERNKPSGSLSPDSSKAAQASAPEKQI